MIGVYFSGTGNTEYCVRKFLSFLGDSLPAISIENECLLDEIKNHKEVIFAYPVYFSNLPKIVSDFIRRQGAIFQEKKVFIIATMGLFSGDGTGCSARLLKKYGARIIGGLHLKMPDCIADERALKRPLEKNRLLVEQADLKMERAALKLKNGNPTVEGLHFQHHIAGLLGQRLWFYGKTKRYSAHLKIDAAKCVGCGCCVAMCPMKNLHLAAQKAAADGKCTMCYRCVNRCPRQAITLLGRKVFYQGNIKDYL